jgi:hypothetical protein
VCLSGAQPKKVKGAGRSTISNADCKMSTINLRQHVPTTGCAIAGNHISPQEFCMHACSEPQMLPAPAHCRSPSCWGLHVYGEHSSCLHNKAGAQAQNCGDKAAAISMVGSFLKKAPIPTCVHVPWCIQGVCLLAGQQPPHVLPPLHSAGPAAVHSPLLCVQGTQVVSERVGGSGMLLSMLKLCKCML